MKVYIALVAGLSIAPNVLAQNSGHAGHDMAPAAAEAAPKREISDMEMSGMDMSGMDHSMHMMSHDQASSDSSQDDTLRDPNAYADGYEFSQLPMRHDSMAMNYPLFRLDRLERTRTSDEMATQYDLYASYGADIDRALVRADGEVERGALVDAETELLWSHAVATYWNTLAGLRYDSGDGPDRTWLAMGVEGLAPYWFEIDATAYVDEQGRSALNIEAEYELLFTQRVVLQPRIEAIAYGQSDTERSLGAGLANVTAGLRLRYELRREFAPYVGVEWSGTYGDTANFVRASGGNVDEARIVLGVRAWF